MVTITREPENETFTLTGVRSVRALLNRLGEEVNTCLVIRGEELLTPDRMLDNGDELVVRGVRSRG